MHSRERFALSDVLRRLAEELGASGDQLQSVEQSLEPMILTARKTQDRLQGERAARKDLQDIDLIVQTMRALQQVLAEMADEAEPDFDVDMSCILERIPLRSLADRLRGQTGVRPCQTDPLLF